MNSSRLRAKSLADVRMVEQLNQECWNEVLQKRNKGWMEMDGPEAAAAKDDFVVKEVGSLRNISRSARYGSGRKNLSLRQ
jgi:hypothetical protein